MNKLHHKDFSIAFKTGTDANKSKFKKEAVQGEMYFATDSQYLYVAETTAGAIDATLAQFTLGVDTLTNTYSLSFDGTNDYVDTNSTFQSTYQSSHTISFWFKLDNTSSLQSLFGAWSGPTSQNAIYFDGTGNIIHRYRVASSPKATTLASFTADTNWHHYAVTLTQNGSNLDVKAYIDGVYKTTTTTAITMSGFSQSLNSYIGMRNGTTGYYLEGKMDEVAIFGSVLSDGGVSTGQTAGGDIATLYNSGVPDDISSFSPVGWWRMGDNDSGTGTTITDQGSGGNDATLTNGPTFSTTVPS